MAQFFSTQKYQNSVYCQRNDFATNLHKMRHIIANCVHITDFLHISHVFFPRDNVSCREISPHDRFFSTATACGACDKYQVCMWFRFLGLAGRQTKEIISSISAHLKSVYNCFAHASLFVGWAPVPPRLNRHIFVIVWFTVALAGLSSPGQTLRNAVIHDLTIWWSWRETKAG